MDLERATYDIDRGELGHDGEEEVVDEMVDAAAEAARWEMRKKDASQTQVCQRKGRRNLSLKVYRYCAPYLQSSSYSD